MLVLSRKLDESILIDGGIRITVLGVRGNQVRLGIEAPSNVKIVREELTTAPRERKPEVVALDQLTVAFTTVSRGGPLAGPVNRLHEGSRTILLRQTGGSFE